MPRPNERRSIASEANLARRIAHERESRGLSYEGLAKLMTDAGCPIQGSAIYKIEKGDPPRRITVDELVALSSVLGEEIDHLLTPMEILEQQVARELIEEIEAAENGLSDALTRLFTVNAEFLVLAEAAPELFEYVRGHRFGKVFSLDDIHPISGEEYEELVLELYRALLRVGADIARTSLEKKGTRHVEHQ